MLNGALLVVGHMAINETGAGRKKYEYFGGAAYQVAWVAGLCLPGKVRLVSVCGRDFDLGLLGGVDVTGVELRQGRKSDRFVVKERGAVSRSFGVVGGLWKEVSLRGVDFEDVAWVHLATAPPRQQLGWLRELGRVREKVKVSADTFELFVREQEEQVGEVFSKCDLVFANEEEWAGLEGKPDCPVVLKLGKRGVGLWRKGRFRFKVPAKKVRVKDTTGAGEVVAGVFLGSSLSGRPKEEALARACELASWSVTDYGIDHIVSKIRPTLPKSGL